MTLALRMINRNFRRNPAKKIGEVSRVLERVYRAMDSHGVLSDFFADPRTLTTGSLPKSLALLRNVKDRPLVSVVVATRNNEPTIRSSVLSLLDQTHANLEVIVVDDASTDRSNEIVAEMARDDHRVQLITNTSRLGTGRSRNLGLRRAQGEFVTFQDGDDTSLPQRIAAQLKIFEKFPNKKLSLCNYVRTNEDGNTIEVNDRRVMKCIISMMFPREEVLERVGYFMDGSISEDSDYYERIKIAFGVECEVLVFRTFYKALCRVESSFFSQMQNVRTHAGRVFFDRPTKYDEKYYALKRRHELMKIGKLSVWVGC